MFKIEDYAIPNDVAEQVADEVRDYIGSAARAWEEVTILRAELAEAQEAIGAYQFALATYRWTSGSSNT